MGLEIAQFEKAAERGGRLMLKIEGPKDQSVIGTGTGFRGWSVKQAVRNDYSRRLASGTANSVFRQLAAGSPEIESNGYLRRQFEKALEKEHGALIANLVIHELAKKYTGFLMSAEVNEASLLAKQFIEMTKVVKKLNCDTKTKFLSDDRAVQYLMKQALQAAGMDQKIADDPAVQALFKKMSERLLIKISHHHSQVIDSFSLPSLAKEEFTNFLKDIKKIYGGDSLPFLQQLNQFLATMPEGTTEEDREFLTRLMLHPSLAQVPAKDRPEVMEQISSWYFEHSSEARNTGTMWYPPEYLKKKDTDDEMWVSDPVDPKNPANPKEICLRLYSSLRDKNTFIPLLYQSITAIKTRRELMPDDLTPEAKNIYLELTRKFFILEENNLSEFRQHVKSIPKQIQDGQILLETLPKVPPQIAPNPSSQNNIHPYPSKKDQQKKINLIQKASRMAPNPLNQGIIKPQNPYETIRQQTENYFYALSLFPKIPPQILIRQINANPKNHNSLSRDPQGDELFGAFLDYITGIYGDGARQFLDRLSQFPETIPKNATKEDTEFLIELLLHPSWAHVPIEQREEAMKLINTWYFERSDRPLNGGIIDDNVDPKESSMKLYSTLKNKSDFIPLLHQSICASDIQRQIMPANLSQTEKKIFLKLTRPHFLLFSPDSIQDYGNYVTFVAQNIHLLPYCKLESSVVMRGETNYQNATMRIKAALQKPRNNSAQSALMRLRLADKLLGDHRRVFLFLTSNNNVSMEEKLSFYVYRNYLIIIYQKIEDIVKVYQQNEGLDRTCLWKAVTGNSIPPDVNSSNFVSRLVVLIPEPVEPEDQSENISPLQKTIVSSTPRDPLLVQIVEELTALCPKDFPGEEDIGRVTLTSFQTKLYTAVRPWVSDRTPNYINDFILALLQPYQVRLEDQTNGRVAFEDLLAEIRGFDRVRQDFQGLQTLKNISEQGAAPAEVISFLRETVRSARNSEEEDKNTKLTEDVLAEMNLERFAVRSDGDCFYHAAAFLLGKEGPMTVRRDLETFFNEKPWRERFSVPDPTLNEQKDINADDPNSGNDSDKKQFSSLSSDVQGMLRQFDFWQAIENVEPSSLFAQRMDELAQMAREGKIGRSADPSQLEILGEWGTLDLIPLLVHIYQRPLGFIAPNVRDAKDKIQPIVCRVDLFTGKSLDAEEPLWLLFNGRDHWDATYRESELLKKNGEWTDVTLDKSTPSKQGNTSRLPVNQMTPNIRHEKPLPKSTNLLKTARQTPSSPSPRRFKSLHNKPNDNQISFLQRYKFKNMISSLATKEDGEFLINLMKDPSMEEVDLKERPKVMEQIRKWYFQQLAELPKDTPKSAPRHPQKIIEELREEFEKTRQPFIPSFFDSIKLEFKTDINSRTSNIPTDSFDDYGWFDPTGMTLEKIVSEDLKNKLDLPFPSLLNLSPSNNSNDGKGQDKK